MKQAISIRLDKDILKRLQTLSKNNYTNVTAEITKACLDHLKHEKA